MTIETSRRTFLKGAATTAILAVGFDVKGVLANTAQGGNLTPFVKIGADGRVCAIVKHFEMGQGTSTGLTTLIAEELGLTLDQIDHEFAPSDPGVYNNLFFGPFQGTGGSTAMANSYLQYRQAGAAAREMLLSAAGEAWGVSPSELTLKDGQISGAGNSAPMADFVAAAATQTVPENPVLKDPSEFRVIGSPTPARKDTPHKINGQAIFGMDMQLDDQMVVVIKRSPRHGGVLADFDDSAAKNLPGYVMAQGLPNGKGLAVFADKTWSAFQARDLIDATWDDSAAETRSSDAIREELTAMVNTDPAFDASPEVDFADTVAALDGAAQIIERDFYFPMLAHAPMEPMGCTIAPDGDGVVIYDGAQGPTMPHGVAAQILELPMEKIRIHTLYAGGSFGRRLTVDSDYHVEAVLSFAMTDRTRPVKLVWSREDDLTGGYYRPAMLHKARLGLDADGKIVGWDHRVAGQSIFKGTAFESFIVRDGVDMASVEGIPDTDYAIPNLSVGLTDAKASTSVCWWRSVGHSHTAFVMETMMDLAAEAAGADPVDYRLGYLPGDTPEQARLATVLKEAAEKANWGKAADGRYQGVAVHKSFGSFVAEVVEISGDAESGVKIEKVTCAVDCGLAVNPDVVRAQMEGGIGYGIGHVMRNQITLEEGAVYEQNFPDYEPLRISDIGAIETHIIASAEAPTGVGEPGTPPSAPALGNAIAAAGTRVTVMPMANNGVNFV
ncbi:MAG: molybdopterin cofactor-binding domain-containing protein [Pseudomonadota bacterium]